MLGFKIRNGLIIYMTFSLTLFFSLTELYADDVVWEMSLPKLNKNVSCEVAPVLYGKHWCYSVEMDDNSVSCLDMAALLGQFSYTDAPVGVKGGNNRRFVGSAALMACWLGKDKTRLSDTQIKKLLKLGWDISNHSYWHTGCHWDKSKQPDREQFNREIFWSQIIFSAKYMDGKRAPSTHVYPCGDRAYEDSLRTYGVRSGSVVGGKMLNLTNDDAQLYNIGRINLDRGNWKKYGKNDPLYKYTSEPAIGYFLLDFTHRIYKGQDSENYRLWNQRISTIGKNHGKDGKDDVWGATTQEVTSYYEMSHSAQVTLERNKLKVIYPDKLPGSPLTLILKGVSENVPLKAPKGGLLYRKGTTVWITTPMLGKPGAKIPSSMKLVFAGPFQPEIKLTKPIKLAAVRLFQKDGGKKEDFKGVEVFVEALAKDGSSVKIPINKWSPLRPQYGFWELITPLPEGTSPSCIKVRVHPELKYFKKMEIWAVSEM